MEKKKLLLVAVSVGVVLLLVVGVPLMMLTPRQSADDGWQAVRQRGADDHQFTIVEQPLRPDFWIEEPDALSGATDALPSAPNATLLPGSADTPGVTLIPGGTATSGGAAPRAAQGSTGTAAQPPAVRNEAQGVTTITVPPPQAPAAPGTAQPARPSPAPAIQPTRPAPAPAAQPARPAQPPAARPAPTPPAPAAQPARAAQTPAARSNFWIQAGAFSSNARAESVRESLEFMGIASIIENSNVGGNVYYRVRIGPYLSETEANYWLALVQSIDGFGASQVRVSQIPN